MLYNRTSWKFGRRFFRQFISSNFLCFFYANVFSNSSLFSFRLKNSFSFFILILNRVARFRNWLIVECNYNWLRIIFRSFSTFENSLVCLIVWYKPFNIRRILDHTARTCCFFYFFPDFLFRLTVTFHIFNGILPRFRLFVFHLNNQSIFCQSNIFRRNNRIPSI